MRFPLESLRAFPPQRGQGQWPGQARSTAFAGMACSAASRPLASVLSLQAIGASEF